MSATTKVPATKILDPQGDDAATMNSWSDRAPATIVKRTAKTIWVQEDKATRIDGNGLSEQQTYLFERDYDSLIKVYSLRKNGRWIRQGAPANARGNSLTLGVRNYYHDFSF